MSREFVLNSKCHCLTVFSRWEDATVGGFKSVDGRGGTRVLISEHEQRDRTMRFPWIPQEPKFFDMFDETAEFIVQAAESLVDLVEHADHPERRMDDLTDLMRRCSRSLETLLETRGCTFLAPLEWDDIHALAKSLGDVLENLDEAAFRLTAFHFDQVPAQALKMALLIRRSCSHLQQAIHLCRGDLGSDVLADQLRQVDRLREEAAEVHRQVEVALFAAPPEIMTFLKQRDLYARLHSAAGACCEAARVVKKVVVKGS